jgi:hypothetical protein
VRYLCDAAFKRIFAKAGSGQTQEQLTQELFLQVREPDGALDRCGAICDATGHCTGHFPCAANVAMSAAGHVIVGFNGEGWRGGQANQWLHYDGVTGLFLGQVRLVSSVTPQKLTA